MLYNMDDTKGVEDYVEQIILALSNFTQLHIMS